jgi:hypothetical protein
VTSLATLTWDERCHLAQCYAPHSVLFPEQQALGRPGKATGPIGDYHPHGIGPLVERSWIAPRLFWPRRPAPVGALAKCENAGEQLLIIGKLIPDPECAWKSYFDILNSTNPQGQIGRDRFPLTAYAHVVIRAEADAASRIMTNPGRDYALSGDEVGRPLFQRNSASGEDVSIQYWFCYYYGDWANQHEGDWGESQSSSVACKTLTSRWVPATTSMKLEKGGAGQM